MLRDRNVLGESAVRSRHDAFTDPESGDALAGCVNLAREIPASGLGLVQAVPADAGEQLAAVHRRRARTHHDIPGLRLRHGNIAELERGLAAFGFYPAGFH